MTNHYNEKKPRVDLYLFPNDANSDTACILLNSGKNVFWIHYHYEKENIRCDYMSFKQANDYFEHHHLYLSWTWVIKKGKMKLAKGKGAEYYIWRNLLTMIKKYNNNIETVISEMKNNMRKLGYSYYIIP